MTTTVAQLFDAAPPGTFFVCALIAFCFGRASAERIKDRYPHSVYLFKLAWFVAIGLYQYRLLAEQSWLPRFLGGDGDLSFWNQEQDPALAVQYQLQLAYHLHSFLFAHVTGAKFEMHLHHLVTLTLILASDQMGYRRIGSVVFYLHDVPDVLGYAVKASVAAKALGALLASYAGLLVAWGYFRLYLLARLIVLIYTEAPAPYETRLSFSILLGTLLCLHYYWYYLFLQMGATYAFRGKVRDTSEKPAAYQHLASSKDERFGFHEGQEDGSSRSAHSSATSRPDTAIRRRPHINIVRDDDEDGKAN